MAQLTEPLRPSRASADRPSWVALAVSLAAVAAVALVGGLVTDTQPGSWYDGLDQPAWNPPDWLFGPVWTLLYVLMAVAAWRVWERDGRAATVVYGVQLALNLTWSLVFFGLESTWGGVVVITVLWLAIAATIIAFREVDLPAAWLLAPYLAWVTYAAALNLAIAIA